MPVISTNLAANTALRYLNANSEAQSSALAKLSSGQRIQTASDDASGLAISTKMASDLSVLSQAAINVQSGESVLQTADGALSNISDILTRMKSLSAQSQTGTVSDTERGYIDAEYQQLTQEIDDISGQTKFNGVSLLDGTGQYAGSGVNFLVGTDSSDTINVALSTVTGASLSLTGTSVDSLSNATTAMTALSGAIGLISEDRANVGALLSRLQYTGNVISTSTENLQSAKSSITDVDIAAEQTTYTSATTLTDAAVAALKEANSMSQELLQLLQ
jgi:flagellin